MAVEPPVAEALSLLLPDGRFGAVAAPTVMGGPDGDAPLGAEVLRRATDMNDPGGTFMDGYVAGRLTERADGRTHRPSRPPGTTVAGTATQPGAGRETT